MMHKPRTVWINGTKIYSGVNCTNCQTPYSVCSNDLFGRGACCSRCRYTGTHDEREETTFKNECVAATDCVAAEPVTPFIPHAVSRTLRLSLALAAARHDITEHEFDEAMRLVRDLEEKNVEA